jgi:hypothetical protein
MLNVIGCALSLVHKFDDELFGVFINTGGGISAILPLTISPSFNKGTTSVPLLSENSCCT